MFAAPRFSPFRCRWTPADSGDETADICRKHPMRILLIMDPFIRVPPRNYEGIERVIADLANGLCERGHDITLWAAPGSETAAGLRPFGHEGEWTKMSNLRNLLPMTWSTTLDG